MRLIPRGDDAWDVEADDVVIELSVNPHGGWTFWGVRVGNERFGGRQILAPGEFADWLAENRRDG